MTKSPEVDVEPSVLRWLIESSGWSKEEIAKRLATSLENTQKILSGEKKPTYKQLEELSMAFKRPVAAFLLPNPEPEKPKPKDYRMLPGKTDKFDKKTLLVLRKTRRLQELSYELSRNIKYETKTKIERVSITDNPEEVAGRYRNIFGLTVEKQRKTKTAYELRDYLRDILEDMNIYTFQFSMPVEDARGFVLVDNSPNVIVINSKDSIEARLFSLMHEFAHILLGESAIDLPDVIFSSENKVESWCNSFSASFLLPKDAANALFNEYKPTLMKKETLNYLSRKMKVSKAMLLTSMKKLNFITKSEYENKLNQFDPNLKEKSSKKVGAPPADRKKHSEVGNKFISLVANNYDRDFITYTDALNYLSIKTKNFDKILTKAKK